MSVVAVAFVVQLVLAVGAFALGRWVGAKQAWWAIAIVMVGVAGMISFPLMRVFPVAAIERFGAALVSCVEFTGLAIPGGLFFGAASKRLRERERRAVVVLVLVALAFFVKAGWWMVAPLFGGGVHGLGPTKFDADGVCRQTTSATCVPAAMVTALRVYGVEAGEEEMARLAYTEPRGGTTDSRALWALQRKLEGTGLSARYVQLDAAALAMIRKPVLVQLDWGFFVSHMVPVLAADSRRVVLGDPAEGLREMPMEEFAKEWKGQGIVIERTGK